MNKTFTVALIAGGLLLLDSPEAAAHKEVRSVYQSPAYYQVEHRRAKHMPYWLKRNKSFRRWYKRTHLRRYRRMSWHRLYDMYVWDRVHAGDYRWGDHYYRDFEHRDHDRRHDNWHDKRNNDRRRNRHR